MRFFLVLLLLIAPSIATAQTSDVKSGELELSVSLDDRDAQPLVGEMVLITIRGVYRRHITRESLVQPDFDGFSWSQLGPDKWSEEWLDGKKVKIFRRRMAIYPDKAGRLEIGAFRHDLTLTDEGDDWFDHQIASTPITVEVLPAPTTDDWWFPVKRLQISDQWSNAPDQLKEGEGVLRMIRLEALGVTPEMIPPMPELSSPSAMIFPHPEKRLVELTPEGPVTYAFWRWTIRPTNTVSTIVEPLSFRYFDTTDRIAREVTISAQRVAYGEVVPTSQQVPSVGNQASYALPRYLALAAGLTTFGLCFWWGFRGSRFDLEAWHKWKRRYLWDPLTREIARQAKLGDASSVRALAHRLIRRDGLTAQRIDALEKLDRRVFSNSYPSIDLSKITADLLRSSKLTQRNSRR